MRLLLDRATDFAVGFLPTGSPRGVPTGEGTREEPGVIGEEPTLIGGEGVDGDDKFPSFERAREGKGVGETGGVVEKEVGEAGRGGDIERKFFEKERESGVTTR